MSNMDLLYFAFSQNARNNPGQFALICNENRLTYRDLDLASNQITHFLHNSAISPGDRIAILLPKTAQLYSSLLAVLKLGAAYVPLDPESPRERIEYILKDANVKTIITSSSFLNKLSHLEVKQINLDLEHEQIKQCPYSETTYPITSNDLCYIIYTSGSTGKPKGVEVTHANVCNYIMAAKEIFGVSNKDRIYQGFSVAFDASVEEIWLAFSSGATLVAGASTALHSGANLVEFLNLHEVTVFSTVPTLLSMLEGEAKSLRILILGGEMCPPELVSRWQRPGLRIFNTYGPTEATIVTTYKECQADSPISIGKPIPNCNVFILDKKLNPVEPNKIGELYIGGMGLARGYTQENLSRERFIYVPHLKQRLYRTSDLAYFLDNGEIQLVGRADDQIKLRGFRIELSEIEMQMLRHPNILAAAVSIHEIVKGVKTLVGYVVTKKQTDPLNENELKKFLAQYLPDYMIPSLFEKVEELPLLPSGKVDRKNLPKPSMHQNEINKYHPPQTKIEKKLVKMWEELFNHSPISIHQDFFHDLGGHSLLAAKAISLLRKNSGWAHISMLDLYENPSIAQLAKKIEKVKKIKQESNLNLEKGESQKYKWRYYLCALGQLLGIYAQFTLSSLQFLIFFFAFNFVIQTYGFSLALLGIFLLLLLLLNPILLLLAIAVKWILLGRIKPGHYPLWGWYYLRWWIARAFQIMAPVEYLTGSPLINLYCRLMGAKIGKNCYIGTAFIDNFDLIHIGDDSSIGVSTTLKAYAVENGLLKIGRLTIGNRCFVGSSCALSLNTTLEDDSKLGDQSMLPEGTTLLQGKSYQGSPARPNTVSVPDYSQLNQTGRFDELKYGFLQGLALYYVQLVYAFSLIPGIALINYLFEHPIKHLAIEAFVAIFIAATSYVFLLCLLITLSKKVILGTVKQGVYSLYSFYYVRKWLIDNLIKLSQSNIGGIYATLYLPLWFRTLGAKVGKRAEISTVSHISPDLLTIGDESFLADGVFLGPPRVFRNAISIATNEIGKRAFVGNNASIPQGVDVADGCLIGCLSIAPQFKSQQTNTSWFGSPAIQLPNREVFECFSEKETYEPSFSMYLKRALIDFIRSISYGLALYSILFFQFWIIHSIYHLSALQIILLFPLFTSCILLSLALTVILLKWILMGKYKETIKPAWSGFVWRNELVTGLYDFVLIPMLLETLTGTVFIAFFLRLLGAKIGKECFIDTTFFTEFDLVEIGDRAILNDGCIIQTHLFEDRVMKMAKLKIGHHCNVGIMSVVLYDTIMEEHSVLANLSLLMKGETLPAYSHWCGIPAQRISSES